MKRTARNLVAVLAVMLCMAMSITVSAAPRWSYLALIVGSLEISDDNSATVTVTCGADGVKVDSLKVTCDLQQLDGSWKTIKSWTVSKDSSDLILQKEYAVYKGYSYRLKVTAKAYKDSKLLETVTEYFDYGYYQ